MLKDTSSGSAKFTDEFLDYLYDNSANIWYAAAEAADMLAGQVAGSGSRRKVGDLEIDYGGTASEWRLTAQRWRMRGARGMKPFAGGITRSDKDTEKADSGRAAPAFSVGMHDHAGSISTGY